MIELFSPFSSTARDARQKAIEESRKRLETELGKPLSRMADMIWDAYQEFSTRAWQYSAKILVISTALILALTLLFANTPYAIPYLGYEYITSYRDLILHGLIFIAMGAGVALYLLARKFNELRDIMRLKLPNLYRLDQRLAEDISKDGVLSSIKNEYERQMRNAQDFVAKVREARLERENFRTAIAAAQARDWVKIESVEEAEKALRHRLFSSTATRGSLRWCAVRINSDDIGTASSQELEWPSAAIVGACFALFLETHCHACRIRLRCGEPYQLRYNPVGELFGPENLSHDIPPLGKYKSWWMPDRGSDMFEGGWFCASCHDVPRSTDARN